jgi:hypothetical protein
MPRATEPRDIPLPRIDEHALAATIRADRARAAAARATRLPSDVLAVGSAIRAFHIAQGDNPGKVEVDVARTNLDESVKALARPGGEQDLLTLRALLLEEFLVEVARFESTGEESRELVELGGPFVRHMRDAQWVEESRVLLDEPERRSAYKTVFNAIVAVERLPAFKLTIDEERVLYTMYITRPHPSEFQRAELDAERSTVSTDDACKRYLAHEQKAAEAWRIDKIKKLGGIDDSYPASYALGVAYYRLGRYDASVDSFRAFVDAHPDGPLALRAKNHLKAALAAYGAI